MYVLILKERRCATACCEWFLCRQSLSDYLWSLWSCHLHLSIGVWHQPGLLHRHRIKRLHRDGLALDRQATSHIRR